MSLYRLHALKKIHAGRILLDIEHLEIEPGSIYGLLGANGAGKTTLLQMLAFLDHPCSGKIEFRGEKVRFAEKDLQLLRRDVIMVDQHPILFSGTVRSNLDFGLKIRKIVKKEREKIIDRYLDLVDMRSFKKELAQGLSGGETQRIALARALCLAPKVFLCDEPTSSVDVENQNALTAILRQVNEQEKISIIFTTHDRLQAASLAQHTLVLDHGRLVDSLYENFFSCVLKKEKSGLFCHINGEVRLFLPESTAVKEPGRYKVFIDPKSIEVVMTGTEKPADADMHGRVVQLMEEGELIRIVVKSSIMVNVLMPKKRYGELPLKISDKVRLLVNPEKLRFL